MTTRIDSRAVVSLVFVVLFIGLAGALAADPIVIGEGFRGVSIRPDQLERLTQSDPEVWSAVTNNRAVGFSSKPVTYRTQLLVTGDTDQLTIVDRHGVDFFDIVLADSRGSVIGAWESGRARPLENRSLVINNANISLPRLTPGRYTLVITLAGSMSIAANLEITQSNSLGDMVDSIVVAVLIGIYLTLAGLSLEASVGLRQPSVLWYAVSLVGGILFVAGYSGFGGAFLWGRYPGLTPVIMATSLPFSVGAFVQFTVDYYGFNPHHRLVYRILQAISYFFMAMTLLFLVVPHSAAYRCLFASLLLTPIPVFLVAYLAIHSDRPGAFLFAVPLFLVAGAFVVFSLASLGVLLPVSFINPGLYVAAFAFAGGSVVVSASLSRHVDDLRREAVEERERVEAIRVEVERRLDATRGDLSRAERLAALTRFAAGTVHEANSTLGGALTVSTYLAAEVKEASAKLDAEGRPVDRDFLDLMQQSLDLVIRNLERSLEVMRSYRRAARDQATLERQTIQLVAYLRETLSALSPQVRSSHASLEIGGDETIEITTTPGLLVQILVNLVTNSLDHAFPNGVSGMITIGVERTAEGARITYRDNGRGMSAYEADHAFDEFYTTSAENGGTGLGLYIVRRVVTESLGGTVSLDTTPGDGVLFTIDIAEERV